MKIATEFGRALKILRIDLCELLGTMADKLGISPAYLSSIECGERNIPEDFIEKLCSLYSLTEEQKSELYLTKCITNGKTTIQFGNNNSKRDVNTLLLLSKDYSSYSPEQLEILNNTIEELHKKTFN